MKGKVLMAIMIFCVLLLGVLSLFNYERGYSAASAELENPFDCYDWKGFVCVDESSDYKCCDVIQQKCNKDYCEG